MATAQEYADWIVRNADKKGTPEFETVAKAYSAVRAQAQTAKDDKKFAFDPERDMTGTDRVLAGMGKAFTDVARGAGQLVGAVSRKDVEESRKLDAPLMATTGGKVGNFAGNMALMAPTALVPGAATITGGALIGAGAGMLQPSTSTGETLTNIGLGGVAGAAVPAAIAGFRTLRAAAEPFYEGGRNAIVGRALNRAAGADAPAVAGRLREASTPFVGPSLPGAQRTVMGEFVPGSLPTVGQAAGNPGIAALERAATASNPEVTNAISQMMQAQNAARVGVLDDMAGRTSGARDFFDAARTATANQLYGQARQQGIPQASLTPQVQENLARLAARIPEEAMARARQLARINGEEMTNATSVQGMHWVKMAIDDLAGQARASGNATLARAYSGLQDDFLRQLDAISPAYGEARRTFAAMSRPINQMDTAAELQRVAVHPLSGNLQPATYARALNDQTAVRATGMPTATLEGTMEPAQLNALRSILLDVQRANAAQTVGRGVGSDTVQKLAYVNIMDEAGVPTVIRNFGPAQIVGGVGGRVADAAYGRANRELGNRLAEVMLDPAQAATLMLSATPRQQNQMLNLLTRSGSGLALSAPASANAQKQ
jgi:hypothetical protein